MKHTIAILLVLAMVLTMGACGAKKDDAKLELTEKDGILEALDLQTSPFKQGGLRTQVDAANGTVTFTKTDDKGSDTKEYYKFTPAENQVEEFYYVSMMGTGFYYFFDLEAGEMVRMENMDHEDSTQSAKDNNRFDSAAAAMKEDVAALQTYFEANFGKTVADAAAGK